MKKTILLFSILLSFVFTEAQETSIDKLFRNSYHVWELQRNGVGAYRDSKLFDGDDYHPCSVANIGIGLISLCIADSMEWDENAMDKALITLKSVTGHALYFHPERNASGFFRHFIDMNSGLQAWNSEFSTIDTEILVAGALFAKNYFKNDSISKYAMKLWNSIDHEKAIADADNGKIYLTMEENGDGTASRLTSVYNEYMIVAWMAKNATTDANSPAHKLWNKFYSDPDNLPATAFGEYNVLTDRKGNYLSSFTHLFNYYMCHYFTSSPKYIETLQQSRLADIEWWQTKTTSAEWEWGCGAGTGPSGYNADKINANSNQTVSPHIIAGYLPIFPEGENQLKEMWQSLKGRYSFTNYPNDTLLWRYSLKKPTWNAPEVQGIDYSTFLFGLASLPKYLGADFFKTNNDFFSDPTVGATVPQRTNNNFIRNNNPVASILVFEFLNSVETEIRVEILSIQAELLIEKNISQFTKGTKQQIRVEELEPGIYFLRITAGGEAIAVKKFVKI